MLPVLGRELGRWARASGRDVADDGVRGELEAAALTWVFRALFLLYAESAGHLPMSNHTYAGRSFTRIAQRAAEEQDVADRNAKTLWRDVGALVEAMRTGQSAWGVPAYNGALFAPDGFDGAEILEAASIPDAALAPALVALARDPDDPDMGVDFSGLEIGHLGHIYEGLLSLRLSVADRDFRYDAGSDRYVPASGEEVEIARGDLLWLTNEGGRKGGGVYYTRTELVRHLVREAVRPAFERHLAEVRELASADPKAAAHRLFEFFVLDPACGSAHFLVEVVEELADQIATLLGELALPAVREELDALRAAAGSTFGAGIEDTALLKRLVLKRCVYGVDLSRMGAEIAKVSLWLGSFVPGLSLAYLDHNVRVGNSLIGVARPESMTPPGTEHGQVVALRRRAVRGGRRRRRGSRPPARDRGPQPRRGRGQPLRRRRAPRQRGRGGTSARPVGRAAARPRGARVMRRSRRATRSSREERRASASRRPSSPAATAPCTGRSRSPRSSPESGPGSMSWLGIRRGRRSSSRSSRSMRSIGPACAPCPRHSERPKWQPSRLTGRSFPSAWRRRASGSRSCATIWARPVATREAAGDPDVYKFFCQRYRELLRSGGRLGVVLPRSVFLTKGSAAFRSWLFDQAVPTRIDFLLNNRLWAFDTHPQYTVALLAAERRSPKSDDVLEVAGVARSAAEFIAQSAAPGLRLRRAALGPELEIPLLRSQAEADLLGKLRTGSPFSYGGGRWRCFPVAEFHETADAHLWEGATAGRPLWKGESFDQFDPKREEARVCPESEEALAKARKPRPGAKSLLADEVPLAVRRQAVERALLTARVAFRDVSRATDSRTVRACLVPPEHFLVNSAPYLAFIDEDACAEAACLALMNSLVFDWQARRFVETHVNFFVLEGLRLPDLDDDTFAALAATAGWLSCPDDRFADFAAATDVEVEHLDDEERARLRAEIDGWSALALTCYLSR